MSSEADPEREALYKLLPERDVHVLGVGCDGNGEDRMSFSALHHAFSGDAVIDFYFAHRGTTARAPQPDLLIEALREIAFLGLDRPAAMGGTDDRQDAQWYRSRAHAAIGIAARALSPQPAPLTPNSAQGDSSERAATFPDSADDERRDAEYARYSPDATDDTSVYGIWCEAWKRAKEKS